MTAVPLGVPGAPARPAARRRVPRRIQAGPVAAGGGAPVRARSMTTTRTSGTGATLRQIAELTASGCRLVRVACPAQDDADAPAVIAGKSRLPVIADIRFQPTCVSAAIEAGCAAVRVNPGAIEQCDDEATGIARAAKDHGTPVRVGVNAGSPDRRLLPRVRRGHARRILVKGEVVKTVPASETVETLIEEAVKPAGRTSPADHEG